MAEDFSDILQMGYDDVPDDIVLPTGEYWFRITGFKVGRQPNENRTPFVQFIYRPISVIDSTLNDEDLINAFPVSDKIWMSKPARKMAKRWFENTLGFNTEGLNNDQLFEMAVGSELRAAVVQNPPKEEGKSPWVEVKRYFRAETTEADAA